MLLVYKILPGPEPTTRFWIFINIDPFYRKQLIGAFSQVLWWVQVLQENQENRNSNHLSNLFWTFSRYKVCRKLDFMNCLMFNCPWKENSSASRRNVIWLPWKTASGMETVWLTAAIKNRKTENQGFWCSCSDQWWPPGAPESGDFNVKAFPAV